MPPKRKLDDVDMMSNTQIPITSCLGNLLINLIRITHFFTVVFF